MPKFAYLNKRQLELALRKFEKIAPKVGDFSTSYMGFLHQR
jgi:hypothetical protein